LNFELCGTYSKHWNAVYYIQT